MKVVSLIKQVWSPRRSIFRPPFAAEEPPNFFFLTVLFFIVSYYTQLGVRIEALGSIRHELVTGIALIGMSIISVAQAPPNLGQERNLLVAMAIYILVHLIMIPLAVNVDIAQKAFQDNISKNMMMCLFLAALIRSPRHLLGVTASFVFSMFWIYQEAVRGLISGSLVWRNQGIPRLHGSVPRYGHSNGLSLAACMGVPFIFYMLPPTRRFFLIAAFLAGTAVLAGLCIVNTGSRAGYIGIIALIPYWIFDGPGKGKRLGIAAIGAAAILPMIPDDYSGRFESISGEEVSGHSREARIEILEDAWEVFKRYPAGTGIGGFPIVRQRMFGQDQDTHNLYAQIGTHLGVQGLIAFTVFIVAIFQSLNRSLANLAKVRKRLARALTRKDLPTRQATAFYAYEVDLVRALIRAFKMLVYFLLVNGLFAHTAFHDIWWFLAGITLASGGITSAMAQRAARVDAYLEQPQDVEIVG